MFKPFLLSAAVAVALSSLSSQAAESAETANTTTNEIERITVRGAYFGKQNAALWGKSPPRMPCGLAPCGLGISVCASAAAPSRVQRQCSSAQ